MFVVYTCMGVFIDMHERGKFLNPVFDLHFLGMGSKYSKWVKVLNLLLFPMLCEKFLWGSWEPRHHEYILLWTSPQISLLFYFSNNNLHCDCRISSHKPFFSSKLQNKVCMNKSWFTANPSSHCMSVISGVVIIFRNSGSVFLIYLLTIIHGSQTFGHFQ